MKTNCSIGKVPGDDNGYFEQMTKAVFRSGFNWKVIENKWPGFQKAFSHFSIQEVAYFDEPELDNLLKDKSIIRNYRKIQATINNAQEILAIQKEHGSFEKYLKKIEKEGEEKLCKTLNKRFAYLGKATSFFFLRAVGLEMPETGGQWKESQKNSTSIL